MAKILSKSGDSLADVYDVKGSIAGIEDLQSDDVNLVHEMGATIFSERLSSRILAITTGAIAQSQQINTTFTFTETSRLFGIQVITDNVARLNDISVHITSAPAIDNTDIPIFAWVGASDSSRGINVLVAGSLLGVAMLIPASPANVPNLMIGVDSPRPAAQITLRGDTTAFGAGTVTTQLIVHVGFPQIGGVSSRGLPLPGW